MLSKYSLAVTIASTKREEAASLNYLMIIGNVELVIFFFPAAAPRHLRVSARKSRKTKPMRTRAMKMLSMTDE